MPKKINKKGLSINMPKLMPKMAKMKPGRDDMAKNIAMGAGGVALTAGLVAAGAALANSKVRKSIGKVAEKGVIALKDMAAKMPEEGQRYMATAHEIARGRKRGRAASKRGRKRS